MSNPWVQLCLPRHGELERCGPLDFPGRGQEVWAQVCPEQASLRFVPYDPVAQAWSLPFLSPSGLPISVPLCHFCCPVHLSHPLTPVVCLSVSLFTALTRSKPLAETSFLSPFAEHPQEELCLSIWLFLRPGLFLYMCQEDPGLP